MPRHYDLARMAITTPPLKMNNVCRAYLIIANALEHDGGFIDNHHWSLCSSIKEGQARPRWNRGFFMFLGQHIREWRSLTAGTKGEIAIDDFMIEAFKDLSPIRDEYARRIFERLCHICRFGRGNLRKTGKNPCIIWNRGDKQTRSDGSIVMNLHLSHELTFEDIIIRGTRGDFGSHCCKFADGDVLRYELST